MGYAGLPSHIISKENFDFLDCWNKGESGIRFQKHPRKPTRLSTPCGTGVLLTQVMTLHFQGCHWMCALFLDETSSRGQHCSQWEPSYVAQQAWILNATLRDNIPWEGIWWRKARNVWFLSCFLLAMGDARQLPSYRSPASTMPLTGSFLCPSDTTPCWTAAAWGLTWPSFPTVIWQRYRLCPWWARVSSRGFCSWGQMYWTPPRHAP